jgi:hypothetical protein
VNTRTLLIGALAAGLLAFGATSAATSAPASAHSPEVAATCSTLTVSLQNYGVARDGATVNRLRVEIDRAVVADTGFGVSHRAGYPLGDSAVAHDYTVTIDAPGTRYDRVVSGSSAACPPEMTADASASLSVTPPTCDSSGALVLGESDNASWSTPTAVAGPAEYSATATADAGHEFPDGTSVRTFTGSLAGTLDTAACASLVVPPAIMPPATPEIPVVPPVATTPPAATPPVPSTPTADGPGVPIETLAETGSEAGAVAPAGAVLLLAGIGLLLARRVRTADAS